MSEMETCFLPYGGHSDNDLVMESIGLLGHTDAIRIVGGKVTATTVRAYLHEFAPQSDPRPILQLVPEAPAQQANLASPEITTLAG